MKRTIRKPARNWLTAPSRKIKPKRPASRRTLLALEQEIYEEQRKKEQL